MDDIIMSLPEACGERGCPVGWHIRHIWAYADGSYSTCDADGNHDDISAEDVPSIEEHTQAWLDYARHVAATGTDPLHEYTGVPRTRMRREAWRVQLVNSITGPRVASIRRNGRAVSLQNLPEYVVSYLHLDATCRRLQDFSSWAELVAAGVAVSARGWHAFDLDRHVPRSQKVVARELKAVAEEHLFRESQRAARTADHGGRA